MYASMHARLSAFAAEDNDRELLLGASCPGHLILWLTGGNKIHGRLIDGLNSIDDESIDIAMEGEDDPERGIVWTIAIAHIAAVRLRYPLEGEIDEAKGRAKLEASI